MRRTATFPWGSTVDAGIYKHSCPYRFRRKSRCRLAVGGSHTNSKDMPTLTSSPRTSTKHSRESLSQDEGQSRHLVHQQVEPSHHEMSKEDGIFQTYDKLFMEPKAEMEPQPFVQRKRELGSEVENPIDLFVEDVYGNKLSLRAAQAIRDFCPPRHLYNILRRRTPSGIDASKARRAWLDDRSWPLMNGRARHREHTNPMQAGDLYRALAPVRVGHKSLPDADRRLMYVYACT